MIKKYNRIKVIKNYKMHIAGKIRNIPEVKFTQSRANPHTDIISNKEFERIYMSINDEILNSKDVITCEEIEHIIQTLSNTLELNNLSIRNNFEKVLKIDSNLKNKIKNNLISQELDVKIKDYFKNFKTSNT